ncbi:hypothetical protein PWO51_01170 [Streptococcus suis]|nr:hypothetical protein [Streptococcus suis]
MGYKKDIINVLELRRDPIYKETLEYYEYTSLKQSEFDKIRKKIGRNFKKEFPEQKWSDLTENKKLSFWLSLQKYMFKNTGMPFPEKIKRKIESDVKKSLLGIEVEGRRYNQRIDELFTINEDTGRRPYDDMMSAIYDDQIEWQNKRYPALEILQTKIDIVLKILRDEFGYDVDVKEIEKSLIFYHNFEREDLEPLQLRLDGKELSEEERKREQILIDENKLFLHYNKKIRDLDFITYVGNQ